jgi:hypothetical protein
MACGKQGVEAAARQSCAGGYAGMCKAGKPQCMQNCMDFNLPEQAGGAKLLVSRVVTVL